jgi:hypothetical protein
VRSPLPGQALGSFAGSLRPASRSSQFHCSLPEAARLGRVGQTGPLTFQISDRDPSPRQADRRAISESESQFSDRHPSRLRQPSQFQGPASQPSQFQRSASQPSQLNSEAGIHQPSQLQRPAFKFTSRLSCRGRHSPQPSQLQRPAFTSRLSFRGRLRQPSQFGIAAFSVSAVGVASHPRFRPASPARCLSFRATSQQQLPPLSRRRRSAARLRLRCPDSRRQGGINLPSLISQACGRETGATQRSC